MASGGSVARRGVAWLGRLGGMGVWRAREARHGRETTRAKFSRPVKHKRFLIKLKQETKHAKIPHTFESTKQNNENPKNPRRKISRPVKLSRLISRTQAKGLDTRNHER